MARAIPPLHTPADGAVLVTGSPGAVAAEGLDATALVVASELAWDAVLSCFEPTA